MIMIKLLAFLLIGQIGGDTTAPPAGLETICAIPGPAITSVLSFGAIPDDGLDDTVAIRKAIAVGGIIYFPKGVYDVCPQQGDVNFYPLFPTIFSISQSNLTLVGDGPGVTILSGRMPGLLDPETHWTVTGDPYIKINRFGMFRINAAVNKPLGNIQIRSMTLDGNAHYTGNSQVGGNPTTGDGWDMSHKAIAIDGKAKIDNVLVYHVDMKNWRGEELWTSGQMLNLNVVLSSFTGCNASALSTSSILLCANCQFGGMNPGDDLYNGVENFCTSVPMRCTFQNCNFNLSSTATKRHGNAIVCIGVAGCPFVVQGCTFTNNYYCILISESVHGLTVDGNTATNNTMFIIDSMLGLYKGLVTGYSDVTVTNNTLTNSGACYGSQANSLTAPAFPNLTIRGNTLVKTVLVQGPFNNVGPGFVCDSNTIGLGARDAVGIVGSVPLWTNTNRLAGSIPFKVNDSSFGSNITTIFPISDLTVLDYNHTTTPGAVQLLKMNSVNLKHYQTGFVTKLVNGAMKNWVVHADNACNTLVDDLPVGAAGVTMTFNGTLFDVK